MINQKTRIDLDYPRVVELILDYAATPVGKQVIQGLRPLRETDEIIRSLETVAEMQAFIESGSEEPALDFSSLDDEIRLLKIEDSVLEGAALNRIGSTIRCARLVRESFAKRQETSPRLWSIVKELRPAANVEDKIFAAIDERGDVRESASPRLGRLRRRFTESRNRVLGLLDTIRQKMGSDIDTAEGEVTLRNGRYVIPLRVGSHAKVRGIVHDRSRSGATQFVEPQEAIDLNNNLREVELEIYQEIHTILKEISGLLRPLTDDLEKNREILGRVDSIRARARFGIEYGCSIPELSRDTSIRLVDARHPLLGKPGDGKVVPLDFELEDGERSLLISGPNAGGKTVLLKTVGLMTLMTHCGIPPSLGEGSMIPVVGSIYTDIGDDQSIENDLSTFSSKIKIMKEILENADNRSMILLDEVGSGTDPTEGQPLAFSIIEELNHRGSINIFTTHFSELKGIVSEMEGVVNGSLGFDSDRIAPTYRFRKGVPGRSYGLEIAKRLGLGEDVISRALERVPSAHHVLDELIDEWEAKKKELVNREEEIERREFELKKANEERGRKEEELNNELLSRRIEAENQIQEKVLETRKKMEDIIVRLESASSKDRRLIHESRREVEKSLHESRKRLRQADARDEETGETDPLRVGDIVRVENLGEEGVVLSGSGGEYMVRVGNLRVSFPRESLKLMRSAGRRSTRSRRETPGTGQGAPVKIDLGDVVHEIDMRGMLAEDVLFHVQKAIDAAILQGIGDIRFIHGKGKGVLREKVAEILRNERRVKSFRLGQHGEGGTGVTVARIG
jgi:DNA mismatch repair protein MutS2